MAENTKIQWATHTFNPWRGCAKVAPGCQNCYAEAQAKRNSKTLGIWGPNGTRVVASEAMWREPVKWDRAAKQQREAWAEDREERESLTFPGRPQLPRVFCGSMCDVFEDWPGRPTFSPEKIDGEEVSPVAWYGPVKTSAGIVDQVCRAGQMLGSGIGSSFQVWADRYRPATLDDVRARLFCLIDSTDLIWMLLTKRPENVRWMIPPVVMQQDGEQGPYRHTAMDGIRKIDQRRNNLWLGTSIACQEDADRNIPELLKCSDLCAKTFLSIEPLVGPVDLDEALSGTGSVVRCAHDGIEGAKVDWVIVGGESGPNARPCNVQWIRSIVRQCRDAGVPVFVKQVGAKATTRCPVCFGTSRLTTVHEVGKGDLKINTCTGRCANGVVLAPIRDPKGGDPAEWPKDVQVREVPV